MAGIFLSRLQMLLLHAVIFSPFRSPDAFNELNCVEVWMMFLASRSVFLLLARQKDVFQQKSYAGSPGFCKTFFVYLPIK